MSPEKEGGELCVRFVRFSRFAGRKLAYRLLNQTGYRIRFALDNEAVYFLSLSNICQYLHILGIASSGQLTGFMNHLFQLSGFKPDVDYLHQMLPVREMRTYYTDVFPN